MKRSLVFNLFLFFSISASEYTIHKPLHSAHEQFSLKFLNAAYKDGVNIQICPFAIETILKGLSFGSYKITNYEFQEVLKNPLKMDELIEFNQLVNLNLQTALNKGEYFQKQALFVSSSIIVDPVFLSMTQKLCPFETLIEDTSKTTASKIQEWLSNKFKKGFFKLSEFNLKETKGKISPISYIDFSFQWQMPFDPLLTSIDSFQYPESLNVQGIVDMMQQVILTDYYEDESLQAVEIPLENHLAALIFLPKTQEIKKLVESLEKPIYLKKIVSKMKPTAVDLKFPKINFEAPFYYKEPLLKMGLSQAFSKLADFRQIDSSHAISLDSPIQICRLHFHEGGINTEQINKQKKYLPLKSGSVMYVNHPFIFFIVDSRDLTIYNMGCYQSPF